MGTTWNDKERSEHKNDTRKAELMEFLRQVQPESRQRPRAVLSFCPDVFCSFPPLPRPWHSSTARDA
eukprot:760526-Hanusia_phi.AAC.1